MSSRTIEQLNDIEDIKQLKARYCRLIDQKKWDELQSNFLKDAVIEISGAPGGADDTQKFTSAREFIEALQKLMGPLVSVHQVHAPEIELSDERNARGTWAVADRLLFPSGSPLRVLQGWGIYHESYRKTSGRWQIASVRLERLLVEPVENPDSENPKRVAMKLLECLEGQNLDGIRDLFSEKVEWFVPGSSELPWAGQRKLGSQAPDFFAVMWPYYVEGKSSASVSDILADGENVMVVGTFSHVIKRNNKSFTTPVALHLKVRDGKITHLQLYEDTLLISQAFDFSAGAPAVRPGDLPKSLQSGP